MHLWVSQDSLVLPILLLVCHPGDYNPHGPSRLHSPQRVRHLEGRVLGCMAYQDVVPGQGYGPASGMSVAPVVSVARREA